MFNEGGFSDKVTPVPIPNTAVKLISVDGTARATVWESRSPPSLNTLFVYKNTEYHFMLEAFTS